MKPLALQLFPLRLQQSLYYRFYHRRHAKWPQLVEAAQLRFAPQVSMFGLIRGDIISGNIAFNGFYELGLSREIAQLAKGGGLFVDVGANMGYFSLLWTGLNSSARAIAYEAAPRNIKLIKNNIARNQLGQRIALVPKAAGNRDGQISFEVGPDDQTGWGGVSNAPAGTSLMVPVVRLDAELSCEAIDVLKIDVEGADTWVLQGCEKLLMKKQIRRIYFEQNEERMHKLGIRQNDAQKFLRDLGYVCKPFLRGHGEWMAYPARNAD